MSTPYMAADRNTGNQHSSLRRTLLNDLRVARDLLRAGDWQMARRCLAAFWSDYATAPASTRRRWRCGR